MYVDPEPKYVQLALYQFTVPELADALKTIVPKPQTVAPVVEVMVGGVHGGKPAIALVLAISAIATNKNSGLLTVFKIGMPGTSAGAANG